MSKNYLSTKAGQLQGDNVALGIVDHRQKADWCFVLHNYRYAAGFDRSDCGIEIVDREQNAVAGLEQ